MLGTGHVLGDQAADAGELDDLVALARPDQSTAWSRRRRSARRGLRRGGVILDVLFGHASTESGAGHLREVDLEIGGGHLHAGGVAMLSAVDLLRLRLRPLRSPLTPTLSPGGRGWLRHSFRACSLRFPLCPALSPGGRGCLRFDFLRFRRRRGAVPRFDHGDLRARLHRLAFFGQLRFENSCRWRSNVNTHLISLNDYYNLISFHRLTHICTHRGYKPGWAAHLFKEKFGTWPPWGQVVAPREPSYEVVQYVRSRTIAYAKRRA